MDDLDFNQLTLYDNQPVLTAADTRTTTSLARTFVS